MPEVNSPKLVSQATTTFYYANIGSFARMHQLLVNEAPHSPTPNPETFTQQDMGQYIETYKHTSEKANERALLAQQEKQAAEERRLREQEERAKQEKAYEGYTRPVAIRPNSSGRGATPKLEKSITVEDMAELLKGVSEKPTPQRRLGAGMSV